MLTRGLGGQGVLTQGLGSNSGLPFTTASPAEIIRASLVENLIGTLPSVNQGGAWPIFVGHMPGLPDDALCIYDTPGIREGRLQVTGETVSHPGWQIRVRAKDHVTGIMQMDLIAKNLDGVQRNQLDVNGKSFIIYTVTQTSTIFSLGQEADGKRRNLFTLNGIVSIRTI